MNFLIPKAPHAPKFYLQPPKASPAAAGSSPASPLGAVVKLLVSLFFLIPDKLVVPLDFLPKAELAMEVAPALIGVGFILGYRQSAVCVAGSLLSSLALIPLIAWIGSGLSGPLPPESDKRILPTWPADEIW